MAQADRQGPPSMRAIGAHVGVSTQSISRAVRTGRFPRVVESLEEAARLWRAQAEPRLAKMEANRRSAETYGDAKARHERAKADRAELENDVRRGGLLPAAEVVGIWQAHISQAKSLLAGVWMELDDPALQARVRDRIEGALEQLAVRGYDVDPDDEGDGGVQPVN